MLAFAAVRRQLHRGAVRAVEGLVDVEQGLHVVIACGHLVERADGITGGLAGDGDRLIGGQSIDRSAEDNLRTRAVINLHPRLFGWIGREQQQYPAIQWLRGNTGGKADSNLSREGRDCRQPCGYQQAEVAQHELKYTVTAFLPERRVQIAKKPKVALQKM